MTCSENTLGLLHCGTAVFKAVALNGGSMHPQNLLRTILDDYTRFQ